MGYLGSPLPQLSHLDPVLVHCSLHGGKSGLISQPCMTAEGIFPHHCIAEVFTLTVGSFAVHVHCPLSGSHHSLAFLLSPSFHPLLPVILSVLL